MAIADELIALLGFELTGEAAAKRYESTLNRLEKSAERVGAAIGTALRVGTLIAAGAFSLLTKNVVDVNAEFQGYAVALETVTGSAEKAQTSLAWIKDFAKTTPYDVAGVTDAFIKLKAYGIDPITDDALRVLGDTASSMNKPLNAAVEMFADASMMEFERLKEFGLRASQVGDQVTFRWNENGEELSKTMKKNSDEVRAFILENLGDRFMGAMDKQSRTWNGMMSNLSETWTNFQLKIGEAGFFATINTRLEGLLVTLDRLNADGSLDKWADAISNTMTMALNFFIAVTTRFAENTAFLIENWESLKGVVFVLAGAFAVLLASAFPVAFVFGLIGLAVDDFLAFLQGSESIVGNFIEWLRGIVPVSDDAAVAIGALASAVAVGLLAAFTLKPFAVIGIAVKLVAAIAAGIAPLLIAGLTGLSTAVVTGLTGAFALLSNPVGWAIILAAVTAALVAYFWEDLVKLWNGVDWGWLGSTIGNGILSGLQGSAEAIRSWFNSILPPWAQGFMDSMGNAGQPGGVNAPAAEAGAAFGSGVIKPNSWGTMLENYGGNTAAQNGAEAAVVSQTDARTITQTNNVTVNQTVTQATDAPGQAAAATGSAVSGSVAAQRSQIESEPSF